MTSFWANDGSGTGHCTGSGLCDKNFKVNSKGWYTYKGKLVVATATRYLFKSGFPQVSGIRYYNYYDTLTIVINGTSYSAIVLDSCGACMRKRIIDLFVSSGKYSITTSITVK